MRKILPLDNAIMEASSKIHLSKCKIYYDKIGSPIKICRHRKIDEKDQFIVWDIGMKQEKLLKGKIYLVGGKHE